MELSPGTDDEAANIASLPKSIYKDPDDGRQRFLLELEFVQCLANPTYIHSKLLSGLLVLNALDMGSWCLLPAAKKIGWTSLFTHGLPRPIVMIGTITRAQGSAGQAADAASLQIVLPNNFALQILAASFPLGGDKRFKGGGIKANASKWKKAEEDAVAKGGSYERNVQAFVDEVRRRSFGVKSKSTNC
ncbi:hypothetical protein RJ640_021162 [Escallonia rubra]|uniref:Mediator of RNA polymerase II transcription subunit 31 n=2 Tax=Escallonia rubra TaxID=112253 RepID=A0AA88R2C0_9ASTE|nr:hypothetical protein RJ640_021162 [Escallonia rubra]